MIRISRSIIFFLSLTIAMVHAQTVPDQIDFAGMQLFLTKKAKARIQADVDMIRKSPTYFQQKVDRANLFFPIIDKVFAEEGFPSEFKYLALQESSLVSDAVSSSQAVGYWQFKKESAVEVGVRVDQYVDERMNIFASSRGAAKYLKRNQGVLNNWVYTLLSYNLGLGGVKSRVEQKYVGAKSMEIDDDMHWYIFRFLAHKIAYENVVGNSLHTQLHIVGYQESSKRKLSDIANETGINEDLLFEYNKWCLKKELPGNGSYTVVLPVSVLEKDVYISKYEKGEQINTLPVVTPNLTETPKIITFVSIDEYKDTDLSKAPMWVSINRVKAVKVSGVYDMNSIAQMADISTEGFLRFNELSSTDKLIEGQFYFLQVKRNNAIVAFHTVKKGETVWSIAQRYGVKQGAILSKNRMLKNERLEEGRVLWMRSKRPKNVAVEIIEIKKEEVPQEVKVVPEVVKTNEVNNYTVDENLYSYHLVNASETMFSISRMYNVSSDSILVWNNSSTYSIKTGQRLIVGKKKAATPRIMHIVQQGETLYKISKQYNLSIDELLKKNNKKEPTLKLGEVLIIQ